MSVVSTVAKRIMPLFDRVLVQVRLYPTTTIDNTNVPTN